MRGKGILLNDNMELIVVPQRGAAGQIVSGLQVGNTLYQNQALILMLRPGALKLAPTVGVGISDVLMTTDFALWRRKIKLQMEADSQRVASVSFSLSQKLTIDANY